VVKNGILLIDYTNLLRRRGRTRDAAVLEASPTRLRPILMTSLATGFGMLPLALGLGEGSETQAPLATSVGRRSDHLDPADTVCRAVRLHPVRRPGPALAWRR
jgi:hypothetical protein